MSIIKVTYAWEDSGNCRTYYRTVEDDKLICLQDEGGGGSIWYHCIDDGCWYEPSYPIDMRLTEIVIGES